MTRRQRPTYDELADLVAQLQDQIRALSAENAALRIEVATLLGDDDAAVGGARLGAAAAAPMLRKHPPAWAKANVVVVARHQPRQPRAPVPGRRRDVPDCIILHAPTLCPACAAPWTAVGLWDGGRGLTCRRSAPRSSSTGCWSGPAAAAGRGAGG